jgi:hypothetical protein
MQYDTLAVVYCWVQLLGLLVALGGVQLDLKRGGDAVEQLEASAVEIYSFERFEG